MLGNIICHVIDYQMICHQLLPVLFFFSALICTYQPCIVITCSALSRLSLSRPILFCLALSSLALAGLALSCLLSSPPIYPYLIYCVFRLVVGADGANSQIRRLGGFGSWGWGYGQEAVVCTVKVAPRDPIQQTDGEYPDLLCV